MKTSIFIWVPVLTFILMGCRNEEPVVNDETTLKSGEIVAGDVTIESALSDVNYEAELFSQSEQWLRSLAKFNNRKRKLLEEKHCNRYVNGDFPDVSIDTAASGYPVTITIDYGDSTVLHNGRVLSGVVTIIITAEKNTDGAQKIINYNGKIDSVAVSGTETATFSGDNNTARKNTIVSNVTFTLDNGTVLVRKGTTVHEWLEGLATPLDFSDDKIQKTGSISITSSTNDEWAKTISSPLIRLGTCRYYVMGTVEYLLNNNVIATLDYGDGTCDTTAVLTVGDEQIEIVLGNKKAKTGNHKSKKT